jgi:hypothetical protein
MEVVVILLLGQAAVPLLRLLAALCSSVMLWMLHIEVSESKDTYTEVVEQVLSDN